QPSERPQCRQRPRAKSQLAKGTRSRTASSVSQKSQRERAHATGARSGRRVIKTPRKLPMIGAVAISAQSDARNGKVESDAALTIASQSLRVMPRVGTAV